MSMTIIGIQPSALITKLSPYFSSALTPSDQQLRAFDHFWKVSFVAHNRTWLEVSNG